MNNKAAVANSQRPPMIQEPNGGFLGFIRRNYERADIAPIDLGNSGRLESLLADGFRNGAVYYNLGNAYFRAGEYGRAIAA